MKKGFFGTLFFLLAAAAAAAYLSLFIVHQTEQVMVLELGKIKKVIQEPGLNWKIPFVQNVIYFEKRVLDLDSPPEKVILIDENRLLVDAFARYRIVDPLLYYQAVNNEDRAKIRLSAILNAAIKRVLGKVTLPELVRTNREAIMRQISNQVSTQAKTLGMDIVDVRIKRTDLPEAIASNVYKRMQTERQREAAEHRAQGEEQARRVTSNADRQVTVIKANATRIAEKNRGEGDAKRNKIYADAYGKDPDFFGFYRSMQAYEKGLSSKDTRLVITPDSEFFRYFNDPSGKRKK